MPAGCPFAGRARPATVGRLAWMVWSGVSAVVAAWLPPPSTPDEDMVRRVPGVGYRANTALFGPSYRSAYGMVMLMHHRVMPTRNPDDPPRIHDEGIRTHGSVSYRSIVRGTSHGCHRLHNHIAVRLMSFVLRHRPHTRRGQQELGFRRNIEHEGRSYPMAIDAGGYVFRLERPLPINVLEGRVLGAQLTPIEHELPKYDAEIGAYVMPDGQWVTVDRHGNITPREMPAPPEGKIDVGKARG